MNTPIYNKSRKIGDKGVAIVKKIVEENNNWIFRKIPLDDDFGLDGYIDILEDGKYLTGKTIAIQIKTGKSYFKNETPSGWIYRGEIKHLNYYSNIDIPIIIAIVDEQNEKVYWNEFDINSIIKNDRSWTITIRKTYELNNIKLLKSITSSFIDYSSQIENISMINNEILSSQNVFIAIDKNEIENEDYSGFIKLKKWLLSSDKMIRKNKGKFLIAVFGYDNDERELFQITEVRNWFKTILPIFKYWGYFLHMEKPYQKYSGLSVLHNSCIDVINSTKINNGKDVAIEFNIEQSENFIKEIFLWLNEFAHLYNIEDKVVFEQSMKINQVLKGYSDKLIDDIRKEYGY